jgi:hypothetical protein
VLGLRADLSTGRIPGSIGILCNSERVETRKGEIFLRYDGKLQAFLDFVLAQYIKQGVEELDQEKLGGRGPLFMG